MSFIKCRTKKLAKEGTIKIKENGINCEYDGYYNIYCFKSVKDMERGYNILGGLKE